MSDSSVSVTYKGAEIANITESGTTTLKTAGTYCEDDIGLVAQLSGGATLQEKTITENGVYTPDSGYDGLSKVTVNVQAPTKGTVQTFCTDVIANHFVSDSWSPPTTTVRDTTPTIHYKDSAAEVSSGTTLTSSVNCNVGDLVIAAIAVRSALTISDGWTLISTSTAISTEMNQTLSWAYKYAESTSESITVTQASAARIYINMASLQGATGFADNGYEYNSATDSNTFSMAKPSGLVMWGCSAQYWDTDTTHKVWSISNDSISTQLGTSTQSRLALFYDQSNDSEVTFTSGTVNNPYATYGSLTIQGMDKFVDYVI